MCLWLFSGCFPRSIMFYCTFIFSAIFPVIAQFRSTVCFKFLVLLCYCWSTVGASHWLLSLRWLGEPTPFFELAVSRMRGARAQPSLDIAPVLDSLVAGGSLFCVFSLSLSRFNLVWAIGSPSRCGVCGGVHAPRGWIRIDLTRSG